MLTELSDEQLREAARKEKNEYQKQWARKHPERVKKYAEEYWTRRALRKIENESE